MSDATRVRLVVAGLAPPIAWSLHLLLCYLAVTLDCATDWNGPGVVVVILTVVFVGVALGAAAWAWRRRDASEGAAFLRLLAMAGGGFFAATMLVTAIAPVFVARCP